MNLGAEIRMEMNKSRIVFLCLATALVVTSVFGDVRAQDQGGGGDLALDVTVRTDESMSGPEQIEWVKNKTENARSIANRVQNLLDQARKEKDTLKIDCLDDKLTQIRVNLAGVEERTVSLELAVKAGDTVTANQQFTILKIYIAKIDGLAAEAESCVGDIDVLLGQTETTVEIDDDITPSDPSQNPPVPDIIDPDPYPPASGFL